MANLQASVSVAAPWHSPAWGQARFRKRTPSPQEAEHSDHGVHDSQLPQSPSTAPPCLGLIRRVSRILQMSKSPRGPVQLGQGQPRSLVRTPVPQLRLQAPQVPQGPSPHSASHSAPAHNAVSAPLPTHPDPQHPFTRRKQLPSPVSSAVMI